LSENEFVVRDVASGEAESEIAHGEAAAVAFRNVGVDSLAHVIVFPRITPPRRMRAGCFRRVRNADVAESGYAIRTNNGDDEGQGISPHPHIVCDRKF
jgi:hypothetical protein